MKKLVGHVKYFNRGEFKPLTDETETRDTRTTYTHLAYVRNNLGFPDAQLWTQDFRHLDNPNHDFLDRHIISVHELTEAQRKTLSQAGFGNYLKLATQWYPWNK